MMNEKRFTEKRMGEIISQLRQKKGLTQKELSGNYISRNMLSLIESGASLPSLPTLLYICDKLNIDPNFLLASEEEKIVREKIEYFVNILSLYNNNKFEDVILLAQNHIHEISIINDLFFNSLEKMADTARTKFTITTSEKFYRLIIDNDNICSNSLLIDKASFYIFLYSTFRTRIDETKIKFNFSYHWFYHYSHILNQILDFGHIDDSIIINLSLPIDYEKFLLAQNNYSSRNFDKSVALLNQIIKLKDDFYLLYSSYSLLESIYQKKDDFKQAFYYAKLINDLNLLFLK